MSDKTAKKDNSNNENEGAVSRFLKNEKVLKIIVFIGLAGIALIFCTSLFKPSQQTKTTDEPDIQTSDFVEQYRKNLCEELGNMIASIKGAGKTKIMLTMEQSVQNVYATDNDVQQKESSQKNSDSENADTQKNEKKTCIIVRQSDGSEKAITISQIMPKVKGVLVVCDGGEDPLVRQRITEAVSAILNISSAHICVTKLNS
ncbi:MAG: hypothetical protein PUG48_04770 [Clostridia bacterium]|nr:hypothetical protein [Clostridia bacterium]